MSRLDALPLSFSSSSSSSSSSSNSSFQDPTLSFSRLSLNLSSTEDVDMDEQERKESKTKRLYKRHDRTSSHPYPINTHTHTHAKLCQAWTKKGTPCPLYAFRNHPLCVVHGRYRSSDLPELECRFMNKKGFPCRRKADPTTHVCKVHALPNGFQLDAFLRIQEKNKVLKQFKPLSGEVRERVRNYYKDEAAAMIRYAPTEAKSIIIDNVKVATGYQRVVIGDYGSFIECLQEQMIMSNLALSEREQKRFTSAKNGNPINCVHYQCKNTTLRSPTLIRFQIGRCPWANFHPFRYYLDMNEATLRPL